MRMIMALGVAAGLSGCATQFFGSAHVNGPVGCRAACDGWGMDLVGMVKMGEYSDGCICQVRSSAMPAPPAPTGTPMGSPSSDRSRPIPGAEGGAIPAVAGVQMQAAAAAAAQQAAQQQKAMQTPYDGSPGWRPGLR